MSIKILILCLLATPIFAATRVTAVPGGAAYDKYWLYNSTEETCTAVDSDTLRIGYNGSLNLGAGWHFVDLNIPKNAVIVSCSLQVKTRAASSGSPTIGAYIAFAQSDDISGSGLGSCYDQTSISFVLGLSSWSANTVYKWDLGSSGIQAIVNRAGWVANNDVGLYISDDGTSDAVIGLQSYGSYTSTLIVNYNDPPSGFISARATNAAIGVRGTNTGSSVRGKQ